MENQDKPKKNRRFPNNGPTMLMQTRYHHGEVTTAQFLEHCKEQKKGK